MGFFGRPSHFLVVSAAIFVIAVTGRASAQTLSLSEATITRQQTTRNDNVTRLMVSRSDCLANDVMSFPLTISNFAGTSLEVWATQSTSDKCTDDVARTTATATCWRVFRTTPSTSPLTVPIRVQDFAAKPPANDVPGTDASCVATTTTAQPVALWFMLMMGTQQVGSFATFNTSVDLAGPAPPVLNSVSPGGNALFPSWSPNLDPDVIGYDFFCEPVGSLGATVTNFDGAVGGTGGTGGAGGASGQNSCPDAGTSDDGSTGDEGGTSDDGSADACTPGSGSTTDATTGGACSPSVLVPGVLLTPGQADMLRCASITGNTSTNTAITNLKNGQRYAVAMGATDLVKNIGGLSGAQCGAPEPVNGFEDVYRRAGGTAGQDGFCSMSFPSSRRRGWEAMALPLGLGLWLRRRMRRQAT